MSLSAAQIHDIIIAERVSSCLSLVGSAFVFITFAVSDKFRKPINRLVFFATFGNVITNIATLISTGGIEAGRSSPLCQFQALLIQWFMPADALWNLAMGCNVWLSFFKSYDATSLRKLELKYLIACYGAPFIPSFIYLFISTQARGKIYGSATLWCWVSLRWDFLRVATFYGPVWVIILVTIAIYIHVGTIIFKWRKHLLSLDKDTATGEANEFPATGIMKTSEVTVTTTEGEDPPAAMHINKKPSFLGSPDNRRPTAHSRAQRTSGRIDPNKAALKYCKCAMLFFISLLVTWVPSTINRLYTIIRPTEVVFGLNLAAAIVLPLQGFWNALIYLTTSSFAVKCLWEDILDLYQRKRVYSPSVHMRREGINLSSNDLGDVASKHSTQTLAYETERSSSQSELVGQAK